MLVGTLSGFVSCYDILKMSDKAIESQKEILAVLQKLEDDEGSMEALMTLGDMFRESGKHVEAVRELNKAKKIAQENDLEEIVQHIEEAIAEMQNEQKDSLKGKKQKK